MADLTIEKLIKLAELIQEAQKDKDSLFYVDYDENGRPLPTEADQRFMDTYFNEDKTDG